MPFDDILNNIRVMQKIAQTIRDELAHPAPKSMKKLLEKFIALDIDEMKKAQKMNDKRLFKECQEVFRLTKRILQDKHSNYPLSQRLINMIINIEATEFEEISEEEKIRNFAFGWWHEHIAEGWLYHGTSSVYLEYIKKHGMDPHKPPYSERLRLMIVIAKKVEKIRPVIGADYFYWKMKEEEEENKTTAWTKSDMTYSEFAWGNRKGGEYLMGITKTATDIVNAYQEDEKVRQVITKRELNFIRSMSRWAARMHKQGSGIVLKVKLSDPSLKGVIYSFKPWIVLNTFSDFLRILKEACQKIGILKL